MFLTMHKNETLFSPEVSHSLKINLALLSFILNKTQLRPCAVSRFGDAHAAEIEMNEAVCLQPSRVEQLSSPSNVLIHKVKVQLSEQ